jgi:hypothetical protein
VPTFSISVDLGHLIIPGGGLTRGTFPNLSHAVTLIAEAAQQRWQSYASGAPMPNGQTIHPRSGAYARSIQLREDGEFASTVYSTLPYATAIEQGSPAYDMKQMLNYSLKVRVSKDGKRYLIIPFRFNTPNSQQSGQNMPAAVHEWWGGKKTSSRTRAPDRVSGTGAFDFRTRKQLTVDAWKYKYGDRLTKTTLASLGVTGKAADRMDGMLHFRRPGAKAGGGGHDQYIVFRVMSEGSSGWIAKAQPGRWPARTVAETLTPIAHEAFAAAISEDVRQLMGVVG